MPKICTLTLSDRDRLKLENIAYRDENPRARERANTLLLWDEGKNTREIADRLKIHQKTAGKTRRNWICQGYKSLYDSPRCGAPRKIMPEQLQALVEQAKSEPRSANQLLASHIQAGGQVVHRNTLVNALKGAGLVWKRTRHSLKKSVTKPPSSKPSKK